MRIRSMLTSALLSVLCNAMYADSPAISEKALEDFKNTLINTHHFTAETVNKTLQHAHYNPKIISTMQRPYEEKPYHEYRRFFLTNKRIAGGKAFMRDNEAYLNQISKQYGVPASIITAIIGVESNYGGRTAQFNTLDSLYTLAFYYPKRADYFRYELTQFSYYVVHLVSHQNQWLDPMQAH